jgi:hypothetical protein
MATTEENSGDSLSGSGMLRKPSSRSTESSNRSGSGSSSSSFNRSPFSLRNINVEQKILSAAKKAAVSSPSLTSASSGSIATTNETAQATTSTTIKVLPEILKQYPQDIALPSRDVVQALYNAVVQNVDSSGKDGAAVSDQVVLRDAGLLSLEDVVLPALAYQEEQALALWQKRVQRDAAEYKDTLVAARRVVYQTIRKARLAAQSARLTIREPANRERHDTWMQHWQEQRDARWTAQQSAREQRKRAAQKSHPANQDTWREIAFLQTQLHQLGQERDQWRIAQSVVAATPMPSIADDDPMECDGEARTDGESSSEHERIVQIVNAAKDISMSAERIRRAMTMVVRDTVIPRAEHSRRAVYQQFVTQNHRFAGYQGVQNPKGLLKALSQSQADDDEDDYPQSHRMET